MTVAINNSSRPETTMDKIVKGLTAAKYAFGIPVDIQSFNQLMKQNDILTQQQKLTQSQADPSSPESQLSRAETEAGYDFAANKGYISQQKASALKGLIEGDGTHEHPPLGALSLQKNPEASMLQGLIKGEQAAQGMTNKSTSYNDTKKEMQDNTIHNQVLSKLDSNKALTARLTQYQNLDNAYSNLLGTGPVTAQKIQDFQQGIIKNLGITGTSGVGERGERYYNSLDLKAGAGLQFLTGSPVDLANSKFLPNLIDQAKTEQKNIAAQMGKQINALTAGHGSMYTRRPDLKTDLDQAIAAHVSQFSGSSPEETPRGKSPIPFSGSNAQADTSSPESPGIHPETISAAKAILEKRLKQQPSQVK